MPYASDPTPCGTALVGSGPEVVEGRRACVAYRTAVGGRGYGSPRRRTVQSIAPTRAIGMRRSFWPASGTSGRAFPLRRLTGRSATRYAVCCCTARELRVGVLRYAAPATLERSSGGRGIPAASGCHDALCYAGPLHAATGRRSAVLCDSLRRSTTVAVTG